jgi:NADPH:quinone reductase-like Zn-dependent oxidoreductase
MRRALAPSGRLVILGGGVGRDPTGGITVPGMLALAITSLVSRLGKQRVRMLFARISKEDLEYVAGLAVAGKLTPVIGRSYGLADAAQAVRDIEAGHARGKVIVTP